MLSAVPTSLAPHAAVVVSAEDAPHACARRAKPPAGATPAPAPSSTPASGTSGTSTTRSKGKKKPTGGAGSARTTTARTSASGYARTTTSSRASAASRKAGPLAFLDDPKLSMEEKLLKLLAYLNDKWNKDLDRKMKEFKQTAATTTSSSGSSRSASGIGGVLKKAVGLATSAVPQLGVPLAALRNPAVRTVLRNVAGPALAAVATAAGQPGLAPVALAYGPELVDAAAGAASQATSAGTGSGASSGTTTRTTTKESADGLGSDRDAQLKLMEMQRILDQQKEMFSLVSNLLRTTHDTRMAVIQNVR